VSVSDVCILIPFFREGSGGAFLSTRFDRKKLSMDRPNRGLFGGDGALGFCKYFPAIDISQ